MIDCVKRSIHSKAGHLINYVTYMWIIIIMSPTCGLLLLIIQFIIGCCIYSKPHKNGDDSDTSDDDGDWDDCCHEHKVARQHVPHSK